MTVIDFSVYIMLLTIIIKTHSGLKSN